MRKAIKYFIILLVFGCATQSDHDENDIVKPLNIEITEPYKSGLPLSKLATDIKIVPLEAKMKSLIGDIYRLRIYNDRIYLLDSYPRPGLYVFDFDGAFIHAINQSGRGPGELHVAEDFEVIPEQNRVVIHDRMQFKNMWFDLDGEHIEDEILEFFAKTMIYAGDDSFLYYHNYMTGSMDDESQTRYNIQHRRGNELLGAYHPFESDPNMLRVGFTIDNFVVSKSDTLFYATYDDTIYRISNNTFKPFIKIKFSNPTDYDKLFTEMESVGEIINYMQNSGTAYNIQNLHFIEENLLTFSFSHDGIRNSFSCLESGKSIVFESFQNDLNVIDFYPRPVGGFDNTLIYLSRSRFDQEMVARAKQCCMSAQAVDRLQNMEDEFDNPVLVFVQLDSNAIRDLLHSN